MPIEICCSSKWDEKNCSDIGKELGEKGVNDPDPELEENLNLICTVAR